MNRIITLLLCSIFISACGWHLKGSGLDLSNNLQSLYLNSEDYSEFSTRLKRSLKSNGIVLNSERKSSPFELTIGKVKQDRRTVAVGNQVLASEYELSMEVDYSIVENSSAKNAYQHQSSASVIRSYIFDPQDTLGGNREELLIKKEMYNDLVQHILRQLRNVRTTEKTSVQAAP